MSIASRSVGGAKRVVSWYRPSTWKARGWLWRIMLLVGTLLVINGVLTFWWSREPGQFSVQEAAVEYLPAGTEPVVGSAFVGTSIKILDVLLHKPGGFTRNDVSPPGVLMDNMPEWEYGVVKLMRDTTQVLRNDFSRSQSQSREVQILSDADNDMRIDSSNWMFPSPESKYENARQLLEKYALELTDGDPNNAQFYARADNLNNYLELVSKNLGDIGQRLSASVGDVLVNNNGNPDAQAKTEPAESSQRTPWFELDNNFYYARGYTWALLEELRAIRVDFQSILEKKGALASLDQIIRELEKTQKPVWSPVILNGRGFGFTANHSLVMASYVSRANAAILDLQQLLRNG